MPPSFVLRDLPGVAELEAMAKRIDEHPSPSWAPEADLLPDLADQVSSALVGVVFADTELRYDDLAELDEAARSKAWNDWELHFEFLSYEDEVQQVIWDAAGWDVTDGNGEYLHCLDALDRQLVCAIKGLWGRLPGEPMSDEESIAAAERWAANLLKKR